MEDEVRVRLQYALAMAFVDHQVQVVNIYQFVRSRYRWRRGQRRRGYWTRLWILRRRQFGLYDQLLVELRNEDRTAFKQFMRMPTEMYDEILARVEHRIQKQYTFYREPLPPGLKLSSTLRHLASGAKYRDMQFAWRVPHNTLSIVVREVCQAICDEYAAEVMTAPTAEGFIRRWNFPHTLAAIDGKHVAIKKPPRAEAFTTTTKVSSQ
ncbi:LOW QUALITY PROTEIN: uncharacterized protein [Amphiura filiformis]|uniref:LOW QUALITY PROTEIN: uncharacterized protein n=1 Tax=Amphiura filiformis TaxID=82378 RepID=UPI003B21FD9C